MCTLIVKQPWHNGNHMIALNNIKANLKLMDNLEMEMAI